MTLFTASASLYAVLTTDSPLRVAAALVLLAGLVYLNWKNS